MMNQHNAAAGFMDGSQDWCTECASLYHTKQGFVFQSDDPDQKSGSALHGLMNRIQKTYPYRSGSRTVVFFGTVRKKPYMILQSQAETAEARNTCRLTCFRFERSRLFGGQELTPEEQTECGRLMQHVLETECNADHVIRIGFTGVVRAYMTLAETLPSCVESRLLLRMLPLSDGAPSEQTAESPDSAYLKLFSALLEAGSREGGVSQAAIRRADSLAKVLKCTADETVTEQLLALSAEDTALLKSAADGICRVLPEYAACMEMLCALDGIGPGYPKRLPAPDMLVAVYLKLTRCPVKLAVQIENLLMRYRDPALSARVFRQIEHFFAESENLDLVNGERLIRAAFLDDKFGLQNRIAERLQNDQEVCAGLYAAVFSQYAASGAGTAADRPAINLLLNGAKPELLSRALTEQNVFFDGQAAARLFYLQIPCLPDRDGKERPLTEREYRSLFVSEKEAAEALLSLVRLRWKPVGNAAGSRLCCRSVRAQLRAELRENVKRSRELRKRILTSYFFRGAAYRESQEPKGEKGHEKGYRGDRHDSDCTGFYAGRKKRYRAECDVRQLYGTGIDRIGSRDSAACGDRV